MHPVFLFEYEHRQLVLHSLFVTLSLTLSNFLLVLLFNQDPSKLVDYSMISVQWWS